VDETKEVIFVVMGGGIVFAAYRRADLAHRHALCLTGVNVVELDMDKITADLRGSIEILDKLPSEISADIATDWEHDDDVTPTTEGTSGAASRTKTREEPPLQKPPETVTIDVSDIDDAAKPKG